MNSKMDLVTQDNALINASYTLDLVEKRLILLAIAKSRQTGKGITSKDYLEIHAADYAECFGVERQTSYSVLKSASESLFGRYFTYESITDKGNIAIHKARWTSEVSYIENESKVQIVFGPSIVPFITALEKRFTSYFINDVKNLTSVYAVRLYELIIAWRSLHQTPVFAIEEFRLKLGISESEYPRMYDFKKRVLDVAISQINKDSNIQIKMEQHKKGRSITGFSFTFVELTRKEERDPNTVDWINENSKPKRKKITEQEAALLARPGEEWTELLQRISKEYYVIFN